MATITYDLPGSRYISETQRAEYLRKTRVDGLVQTGTVALINEVLTELPSNFTKLDDPFNLWLRRRIITKIECTSGGSSNNTFALVDLHYVFEAANHITAGGGFPNDNGPSVRISSGGSIYQTEAYFDRHGNQLKTVYDNVTQAHRALAFTVQSAPTFTRLERTDPQDRADTHVGTVNSVSWKGYAPRTVLCASILGESDDSGDSYTVEYTFHVRPTAWEHEAIHDDPFFPGNPIPDPVDGTPSSPAGRVLYQVIGQSDFNALQL